MSRFLSAFFFVVVMFPVALFAQQRYDYVTYSHDAMHVRIYQLSNGLQVFLSAYKDAPRIQCLIPVRAGSKNDPAETTGLAHYLEHLMFKGTTHFGTTDYAAEKNLLDEIELLFENYRYLTDPEARDSLYHRIDSLSYVASGYAIPNEYDKLMKYIGSQGTNAATSNDYTVYIENIPSNQLENWAAIQYDRFSNPIFRLFHTELETVYEEKNTSLTNDSRKASEAMLSALFPHHPYGKQTTLGTVEHLKNPSITNIKNFYNHYYTPNNMAICLAGDFDYDEAIAIIDKYFGRMRPHKVRQLRLEKEAPVTTPIVREVYGHEAENVLVAFRMDLPANSQDIYLLEMLDNVLSNGKCGLIDLNLNQRHAVNRAGAYPYVLCDNSAYVLTGRPHAGQTLEEVRDLLLEQIERVKKGEFDESLIEAALNNIRVGEMRQLESNRSRAFAMASAFENRIDWYFASQKMRFYEKVTKQDIIDFTNKHFAPNSYVVVFKRQGEPEQVAKVSKPAITAIQVNRDAESDFFKQIKENKVTPIEPVFVDFKERITFDRYKAADLFYLHNDENELFTLKFTFPAGEMNDMRLPYAASYIGNLGTPKWSVEQIKSRFYQLACSYSIHCSDEETNIVLTGLSQNMGAALKLMMEVLQQAQPDTTALHNLVADALLARANAKKSQQSVLNCLRTYCEYGPALVNYQLSAEQLHDLQGDTLLDVLHQMLRCKPEIVYYGPLSVKKLKGLLTSNLKMPKTFAKPAPAHHFDRLATEENQVFFAPYPAKQSRIVAISRAGKTAPTLYPDINMYNNYFGGGMNAIVFQEMREKRSLAYTAQSSFVMPHDTSEYMYNYAYIATQNDKIVDAMMAFDSLFNAMPVSQTAFTLAKDAAKASIAANRLSRMTLLNTYLANRKMGVAYDFRKDFYDRIDSFILQDVVRFNQTHIQNKPKTYMILAREGEVDFETIEAHFGPVQRLTLEDIFGY